MKRLRKTLAIVLTFVMLFSIPMTAYAAQSQAAPLTAIAIKSGSTAVSSVTLYTNRTADQITKNEVPKNSAEFNVVMGLKKATSSTTYTGSVVSSISDRSVADVTLAPVDAKSYKLTVNAKTSGTAIVTIKDTLNPKRYKKLKVVVKTYVSEITVSGCTVGVGGSMKVDAQADDEATSGALSYRLCDVSGKAVRSNAYISVSSTGVVKGKKETPNGVFGYVLATAKDGSKQTAVIPVTVKKVDTNWIRIKDTNNKDVSAVSVALKTNPQADKNPTSTSTSAYQINAVTKYAYKVGLRTYYNDTDLSTITYKTSNPDVATVDEDGKVVAKGNGKATITVVPVLGNKATAKVTVTVTTDVEGITTALGSGTSIELLAGKSYSIAAKVSNADASNKKVSYEIQSQTPDVNTLKTKTVVAVASNGKLVAKNGGTAKVLVKTSQSYKDGKISVPFIKKTIDVKVVEPVGSISAIIDGPTVKPDFIVSSDKKSATVTTPTGGFKSFSIASTVIPRNSRVTVANTAVTYSSSNGDVATVDEAGIVTVSGKGSAVITATAKDGSGKKASIKVKSIVLSDEITLKNYVTLSGNDYYVAITKGQTFDLGASTNAEATNTGVNIESAKATTATTVAVNSNGKIKGLKVAKENAVELIVSAKDKKRSNTEDVSVFVSVYDPAEVVPDADYTIIDNSTISSDDVAISKATPSVASITAKKGSSAKLNVLTGATKDGIVTKDIVSWTTSNKAVVSVALDSSVARNKAATIKAVKNGTAVVKAKLATGQYVTYNVTVVNDDATQAAVNDTKIAAAISSENRDWLGLKPSYDKVNNDLFIEVNATWMNVLDIANTGVKTIIRDLYEKDFKEATIVYDKYQNGLTNTYVLTKENYKVIVTKNNVPFGEYDMLGMDAFLEDLVNAEYPDRDDAGYHRLDGTVVTVASMKKSGTPAVTYYDNHKLVFGMAPWLQAMLDDQEPMMYVDDVNQKAAELGLLQATYDEASNTTTFEINNADKSLAGIYESLSGNDFNVNCTSAHVKAVDLYSGTDKVVFEKSYNGQVELYDIFGEFVQAAADKNPSKTKLGQTDGIVITFTFNDVDAYRGRDRVVTQTMKFFVTEQVLDSKLDKVIETALVDLNTNMDELGESSYSASTNVVTNTFFETGNMEEDVITLRDSGLFNMFNKVINNPEFPVESAKVVAPTGKITNLTKAQLEEISEITLGLALFDTKLKFKDLVGTSSRIEVTYKMASGKLATMKYEVKYAFEALSDVDVDEYLLEAEANTSVSGNVAYSPNTNEVTVTTLLGNDAVMNGELENSGVVNFVKESFNLFKAKKVTAQSAPTVDGKVKSVTTTWDETKLATLSAKDIADALVGTATTNFSQVECGDQVRFATVTMETVMGTKFTYKVYFKVFEPK